MVSQCPDCNQLFKRKQYLTYHLNNKCAQKTLNVNCAGNLLGIKILSNHINPSIAK